MVLRRQFKLLVRPTIQLEQEPNKRHGYRLRIRLQDFDWLTFESNNKVGFNNSNSDIYTDPESQAGAAKRGTFRNESYNTRSIYTSQMLRMLKTFNEVHEINAFLGYDYDEYRYRDLSGEASNIYPGAGIVNAGASNEKPPAQNRRKECSHLL